MGLARIQTPHDSNDDLTATGVTLGTFDYISPEQARDPRIVDVRSDIYSLGCTFFYMLTGRPPFPEGTVLQKLLQHQGDEPPNIQEFRPEMPEQLSEVFKKLLAKDPGHRYQTPEEFIEHLYLLAAQMGLRPLAPGQRAWLSARRRREPFFQRHLPWIAPVGSLIIVWFFLHLYWTYTAQTPPPEPSVAPRTQAYAAAPEETKIPLIHFTEPDEQEKESPTVEPDVGKDSSGGADLPIAAAGPHRPENAVSAISPAESFRQFPGMDGLGGSEFYLNGPGLAGSLIVDGEGKLPGTYPTLRAACNDAKSRRHNRAAL